MKKSSLFLSVGASALCCGLGIPAKADPASVAHAWTGWYVGAHFGAGAGQAKSNGTDSQTQIFRQTVPGTTVTQEFSDTGAFSGSGDVTGSVADLFAGHNFRQGSFVWGGQIEGTIFSDIALKSIGSRASTQIQTTTTVVGGVTTVNSSTATSLSTFDTVDELRSMFTGVARAGWLARPDTLLYALGGGVLGHFVIPDALDERGGKRNKWVLGWTVGAGGEYRINPNWSVRAEYRYVRFDYDRDRATVDSQSQVSGVTTFTNQNAFTRATNIDVDLHLAKIGIVYTPWAASGAGDSYAADFPVKARPRLHSDPWTGWYLGAYFGAGAGHAKSNGTESQNQTFRQTVPGTTVTQVFTQDEAFAGNGDSTGSVADLFVGYNVRNGAFVWGAQIEGTKFSDVTLNTLGSSTAAGTQTTTTNVGGVVTVTTATSSALNDFDTHDELRSMVSGVVRGGWLANPSTLIYVLGGGVLGHFVIPDAFDPRGGERNKWVLGWTVGGGGEYRINPNWSVRAEYRYVRFDYDRNQASFDSQTQVTGATTFQNDNTFARNTTVEVDLHLAKIGIVYTPWATPGAAGDAYAFAGPRLHSDPWTGVYVGAYFGAGAGQAKSNGTDSQTQTFQQTVPGTTVTQVFTDNGAFSGSGDTTGSVAELFAGYNVRHGSFVWGGQIEGTIFSDVALKASGVRSSAQTQTTTTNVGGVVTVTSASATALDTFDTLDELRSMVTGVVRGGWLARPDTLVYVLGGGVLGHFVVPDSFAPDGGQRNKWVLGWTVGVGGEHRVNANWSIRAEYRYVRFDYDRDQATFDQSSQVQGATTFSNQNVFTRATSMDVDFHLAKIGIVYTPWASPDSARDAYAADFPVKAARKARDPWTGWNVGAYYGAGAGQAKSNGTDSQNQTFVQTVPGATVTQTFIDNGVFSGNGDTTGSVAELFAGYSARHGAYVWGGQIEGTIFSDVALKTRGLRNSAQTQTTTSNVGGVITVNSASATALDTFETVDELRSMVTGVVRGGWLARPDTLLYVLGGGVLGHFVIPDSFDPRGGERNKWVLGWTAGAGGERRINDNWSIRAEYRYVRFDYDRDHASFDSQTQVTATTTFTNQNVFTRTTNMDVDLHLAKIGIVYTP